MKRFLKIAGVVVLVLAAWMGLFVLYLSNWGNFAASQMAVKYQVLGYPQGGTVLMGSSSIQLWTESEADLGPLHSVNVGIGGSIVSTWFPLVDTLVTPFHPQAVVIYVGANDLHNNHTPPADVFTELEQLIRQIHSALPNARLYYVTVYTTGAYPQIRQDDEALNDMVQQLAAQTDYLEYIDCATALLDPQGNVRDDIFLADKVHLNEVGYSIWARTIRSALLADFPVENEGNDK